MDLLSIGTEQWLSTAIFLIVVGSLINSLLTCSHRGMSRLLSYLRSTAKTSVTKKASQPTKSKQSSSTQAAETTSPKSSKKSTGGNQKRTHPKVNPKSTKQYSKLCRTKKPNSSRKGF